MNTYDQLDIYEKHIVDQLTKNCGYNIEEAMKIMNKYQPIIKKVDRYWTTEDWAEILVDNYRDGISVEQWSKHIDWADSIPVYDQDNKEEDKKHTNPKVRVRLFAKDPMADIVISGKAIEVKTSLKPGYYELSSSILREFAKNREVLNRKLSGRRGSWRRSERPERVVRKQEHVEHKHQQY